MDEGERSFQNNSVRIILLKISQSYKNYHIQSLLRMGLNSLAFYQIDRYCQIEKVNFEKREISENSKKMLEQDLAGEDLAITLYKELIKMAEDLGEYANRRIFEEILIEEEENKRDFFLLLANNRISRFLN